MKSVLYICKPDKESMMVAHGYRDALQHLGWKVLIYDPKTKAQTIQIIDQYDIKMIFTSCRYGMSQLPVDHINSKCIKVVIEALPCNDNDLYIDGRYHIADLFDIAVVNGLDHKLVHTVIEENLWDEYFSKLLDAKIELCHIRYAGNIFCAIPKNFDAKHVVSFVGSLANKENRIGSFIRPILDRLLFLNLGYNVVGDYDFERVGIKSSGDFVHSKELCNIYTSSIICPNFHTTAQIDTQAYLNERSFSIQLCGGFQITDMRLASEVFSGHIVVADTAAKFVSFMEGFLKEPTKRFDRIKESTDDVVTNHTYFNRLSQIFAGFFMGKETEDCIREGSRLANMRIWDIEPKLQAAQKGKRYESWLEQIV